MSGWTKWDTGLTVVVTLITGLGLAIPGIIAVWEIGRDEFKF